MSQDNRDIFYAAFGFCAGVVVFFRGFNRLRRKRLIENIPTSTVRGLAMGLVELQGQAKATRILHSPLTKTECVVYKYLVEEYRKSGKSGHWHKIAGGNSFSCPFWLDDGTGKIMVYPSGAEIFWPKDYSLVLGGIGASAPPDPLIEFLQQNGINYRNWLGWRRLRFSEWYICENENVYVLGSAKKKEESEFSYNEELLRRLQVLKSDPQRMKQIDVNQDSYVSNEEWDNAVKKIEEELLGELVKDTALDNAGDIKIARDDIETTFIISENSQKELLQKLSWECFACLYGGPALSLATLGYILWRLQGIWFLR